ATAARELGEILSSRDPKRALAVYDLGIQRLSEMRNSLKARRDRAQLLANSSYPLRRLHRAAEAKSRIDAAFALLADAKGYQVGYAFAALAARADYAIEAGDPAGALRDYEDLAARIAKTDPKPETVLTDAVTMSRLYAALAVVH